MRLASKDPSTSELTTALTKVAFQQWRILIQDQIIHDAKLKIAQATSAVTIPTTSIAVEPTLSAPTRTTPAAIPTSESTIPVNTIASTGSTTTSSRRVSLLSPQFQPKLEHRFNTVLQQGFQYSTT